MTWAQWWAIQVKSIEVGCVLAAIFIIVGLIYCKIVFRNK